jgi:sulfatase maturation enzyme AslB (radical SAM superfamily)
MKRKRTNSQLLTNETILAYKKQFNLSGNILCNAAFSSLYFIPSGEIKPCCALNNTYSFGKYPVTSIKKALKSKNRKTLQKHLKSNNFSFGCEACYTNLEAGNFEASMNTQYLKYKRNKYPQILEFELSHFCNLDCIMCYLHTSEKQSTLYNDKFIAELKPYLKKAIASRYYGGEPFLIPIYDKIWNFIAANNPEMQVHIQSNGTVLNTRVKELLNKLNVFLGISIDAMHKDLYETIRRGANFDHLMQNLEYFNDIMIQQNKAINYSFCPMRINWQEIPEFFRFVNEKKGILFFNTLNSPQGLSLTRMPSSDLNELYQSLISLQIDSYQNPHATRNLQKTKNLAQSVLNIHNRNATFEKEYPPRSVSEFKSFFSKKLKNKTLEDSLFELLENTSEKKISSIIQGELMALNSEMLENDIENILLKPNSKKLLSDFLEI